MDFKTIKPDGIVPFKVSKERCMAAFFKELLQNDRLPDELFDEHGFVPKKKITGTYIPYYQFTGKYVAFWSASSGYEREETHTEWDREWKSDSERWESVPTAVTETVIDWRPSSGEFHSPFSEFAHAIEPKPPDFFLKNGKSIRGIIDFDEKYVKGFTVEPFNISPDRYQDYIDKMIGWHIRRKIPGQHVKDLDYDFEKEDLGVRRFLAPGAWQIAFRYLDEDYEWLVNGLDDTITELPVDKEKARKRESFYYPAWIIAALCIGYNWLYLGMYMQYELGEVIPTFILGLIVFVAACLVGWMRENKLLNKSRELRRNALEFLCD
jgi:hypothetical protein